MRYAVKELILGVLLFSSIIWARGFSPDGLDSLDRIPPNLRYYYMQKNLPNEASRFLQRDSQGVRMIGKWGRGPSSRVTGRDSLVFLSLGSEVAIINMSNPSNPQVIYEVQARGMVAKSVLKDSFLFIGGPGIEIWNIRNPSSPIFRNRIETSVSDFCIRDSFLYAIAGDSFRIFNIANINNPYRIGVCADAGFYISISGSYAYISDRWGLYIVNIQNPTNPYHVSSWGDNILSAQARDTLCYVSTATTGSPDEIKFFILNVSNPNSIQQLSCINYAGGYDIYLLNFFAYISGYYFSVGEFQIIDISNASFPNVVSRCTTAGSNQGVWADNPFGRAFVADAEQGMQIIDISNPVDPVIDTFMLKAGSSVDIVVNQNYAYIANYDAGLKIINISNLIQPTEIGVYDTLGYQYSTTNSIMIKDSFAYIGDLRWNNKFRSVDVSNPAHSVFAGLINIAARPQDMFLKDTLLFIAEDYHFQIVSISNPRQPSLVGSCILQNASTSVCLQDTLAYVGSLPSVIINVKNPSNPIIIGTIPVGPYSIFVKDTFAYMAINYGGLEIWSIANPSSPYLIDTVYYQRGYDVIVIDSIAYFGGLDFRILNVANPSNAFEIGRYTTPYRVKRLYYDSGLIYAACFGAGMCIFEQLPSGIEENHNEISITKLLKITPNPTSSRFNLELNRIDDVVLVYNLAGKLVKQVNWSKHNRQIDISNLPDGVYFLSSKHSKNRILSKVVKISR